MKKQGFLGLFLGMLLVGFIGISCKTKDLKMLAAQSTGGANPFVPTPTPIPTPLCNLPNYMGDLTANINGAPVTGSTDGQPNLFNTSLSFTTTCGSDPTGPDVIYSVQVDAVPKTLTFSLCQPGIEPFDTVISLWSACSAPADGEDLHYLDCNDDFCGDDSGLLSEITYTFTSPGTYYVVVDGYDGSEDGPYRLTVTSP